jgi:ribosomal protein uL23
MIRYPLSTEKSIRMMEGQNALVFVVDRKDTKPVIKQAVEAQFGAKVRSVRTHVTTLGVKRAIVTFTPETPAIDIATKLGML